METIAKKEQQAMPGDPSLRTRNRPKLSSRTQGEPLRVLSEQDWKFWIDNGYVIIKQAITREQAAKSAALLWEYEGKDLDDPESWYKRPDTHHKMEELNNSGMVEIYNSQMLWDNRQSQRIHQAFADIWGTEKL